MKRALSILLVILGCRSGTAPDAQLQLRLPLDKRLWPSVANYPLRAQRDGRVLAQQRFPASAGQLSLDGVPFGPRTVFQVDGIANSGDVIARGTSCPIEFKP